MIPGPETPPGRPLENRDLRLARRLRRRSALAFLIALILGALIGLLANFL